MSNQAFGPTSISSLPQEILLIISSYLSLSDFLNLRNSTSFYYHLLFKELSEFGGRILSWDFCRGGDRTLDPTLYQTRLFQDLICTRYNGSPEMFLLTSASFGFWGTATHLLNLGTKLDETCAIMGGLQLLEAIISRKSRGIPSLLVLVGSDLTQKLEECGSTALHLACQFDDLNLIQNLLNHGANIESHDKAGRTPLFHSRNSLKIAEILLHHGANINVQNGMGSTCLHYASTGVTELLLEHGADTNIKNDLGNTPLHEASTSEKIYLLLNHNADVNSRNRFGCTPLFYAETTNVAQVLIERKADVNCINNNNATAFHEVTTVGILQVLLKHRKDSTAFDTKDYFGLTPFNSACLYLSPEFQQIYLECGVDINTTDIDGNTPLHYTKCNSIVQNLVANGACVNRQNLQGSTPLHYAFTDGLIGKAEILLAWGANPHIEDGQGITAFSIHMSGKLLRESETLAHKIH